MEQVLFFVSANFSTSLRLSLEVLLLLQNAASSLSELSCFTYLLGLPGGEVTSSSFGLALASVSFSVAVCSVFSEFEFLGFS